MTVREFIHNYINRNVLMCEQGLPIEVYDNEIVEDNKIEKISTHCELYRIKMDDEKSHLFLVYKAKGEIRMDVNSAHFTFGVGNFSFCYGKYIICNARDEYDVLYEEYMKLRQTHTQKLRTIHNSIPKDVFKGYQMGIFPC